MEEVNQLTEKDTKELLKTVEKSCGIIIPYEKERLGELSFHLYKYDNTENTENYGTQSWTFQIRYGVHTVFTKKHIKIPANKNYNDILVKFICDNNDKIYASIVEYCQNQMNTMIAMELEPEFNRRFSYIFSYDMKLCKSRNKNKNMLQAGWPNFCIAISWNDDYNEFQEFMYPLTINPDTRKFNLNSDKILTAFQRYCDSII
ncbi:MAG: hypothetical protein JW956_08930 [Calditrichaceae bacterium]|nr:hypothetical protein [Calditrichaceae bacterium]